MSILLIFVHVVVCIALIMIVLLQTGKGADMGAAFGGGSSQTLFGSTGASTFLSKLTTGAAIVFMITSLALAYVSTHQGSRSIMTGDQAPAAVEQTSESQATDTTTPAPAASAESTETTATAPEEKAASGEQGDKQE